MCTHPRFFLKKFAAKDIEDPSEYFQIVYGPGVPRYLQLFEVYDAKVVPIQRLAKLKKFEIDVGHVAFDINALLIPLAANKKIEHLQLGSIIITDAMTRTLCEFKTLKILKLTSASKLDREIYKKFAFEMASLMEIHIIECVNTTFSDLIEFVEHSTNLEKIVFIRYDERPSLTQDIVSSFIEVLKRKERKETLNVHLNDDDICDIENDFQLERSRMLIDQAHMIKFLPLDEESIKTMYEFGSGFRRHDFYYYYYDINDDEY